MGRVYLGFVSPLRHEPLPHAVEAEDRKSGIWTGFARRRENSRLALVGTALRRTEKVPPAINEEQMQPQPLTLTHRTGALTFATTTGEEVSRFDEFWGQHR